MTCPICAHDDTFSVFQMRDRANLLPTLFTIKECRFCSGQFISPMPDSDESDPYYEIYWSGGENASLASKAEGIYKNLLNWSELVRLKKVLPRDARILDIGCGAGDALSFLHRWGYDCCGLEASEAGVQAVKARLPIDVYQGSIDNHPFEPQSFDCVLLSHVLEHMVDPERVLKEIRKLLRPNGLVCLMVPNLDCIQRRLLGKSWFVYIPPRHVIYYTPRSISILMERFGFSIQGIHHLTLKHGPAILINSVLPMLDPFYLRRKKGIAGLSLRLIYFALSLAAMPLVAFEGFIRHGATIMILARPQNPDHPLS